MFSLFSLWQQATFHGLLHELTEREKDGRGQIFTAVRGEEGLRFVEYGRILFEGIGEENKSILPVEQT
jgi:hypothetical protein